VEFDPMRVPLAAAMDRGHTGSFAEKLDAQRRAAAPAKDAESPPARCEPCASATADAAARPPARTDADADADADAKATADAPVDETNSAAAATAVARPAEPDTGGEPVRRTTAEEGAGTPLESSPPAIAGPTGAAVAGTPVAGTKNAAQALVGTVPETATATPVVRANVDRLAGFSSAESARPAPPKAAAAGYRTLTPQALQLDEQARDSVFRQILFRLDKDSSEMRLRLDPPELGQLDLHLMVEKGNTLRLSIGTDRADLRDLLLSGLDQLKKDLQQNGLTVTHAEVHTRQRDAGTDQPGARDRAFGRTNPTPADAVDEPAAHRAGTGWHTASGLDFWI
jgi:flagellar hook-length control protein FliK